MNSRTLVRDLIAGKPVPRCGFWMGNPDPATWPILRDFFKVETDGEVRALLGDDLTWVMGDKGYRGAGGHPAFPNPRKGDGLAAPGVFSDCESVAELESYPWPKVENLDFTAVLAELRGSGDIYRASGMWCPFFHLLGDLFGMEGYFIKMYTHPEVVHAVTRRMVDFFLAGTEKLFKEAGEEIDGFFFGNDFGTQRDILVSPECFREFIFPYFKELTDLGHAYGKQVILHSCGAIDKVIPDLIRLGVEALHPLQARAEGMGAEELRRYQGRVTFFGNIDTQDLLVNGTPEEVAADVRRVKRLLGPRLIVSPSHEALLPNIPPANVLAMSRAAFENC